MAAEEDAIITLQNEAREAAEYSYSPYSRFRVGAALLGASGKIYRGANIENRSFGLTNCAERSALFAALSQGEKKFLAITIYSPDGDYPLPPCGACRQVISEFVPPDFPVYFSGKDFQFVRVSIQDLLPHDALHELADR